VVPATLVRACEALQEEHSCALAALQDPQVAAHAIVRVSDDARAPWAEMHVLLDARAACDGAAVRVLRVAWPSRASVRGAAFEMQNALRSHVDAALEARVAALAAQEGAPFRLTLGDCVSAWRWSVDGVTHSHAAGDSADTPGSESTCETAFFHADVDPVALADCCW